MKTNFQLELLVLSFFLIAHSQAQVQPDQVIEIFRHGARGPLDSYDPQWSSSELGQLTTVGMVEQYNLGKTFATKYSNLVAAGFSPSDVYVLSDDVKRCIESAMVQVSSIFRGLTSTLSTSSPKGLQDNLIAEYTPLLPTDEASRGAYVPVEVNIATSGSNEYLIFNGNEAAYCSKLSDYSSQDETSSKATEAWTLFQDPIEEVNALLPSSEKINNMGKLVIAYDAFIADVAADKTLPGGISDYQLIENLGFGQAYYIYLLEQGQKIQRQLTSFNTIHAVLDQVTNFRAGKNPKKLALYSAHDKNMYAVLAAFGVVSEECLLINYDSNTADETLTDPSCQYPAFASYLTFEFYNDTANPYIKFYYNETLVPLCNGQDSCGYEDFLVFARSAGGNNTLASWNDQCKSKPFDFSLIVIQIL